MTETVEGKIVNEIENGTAAALVADEKEANAGI